MMSSFNAYHKWLGIAPEEQPPNHYRLLGINLFEQDDDVISHAADQRMAHVRTFQSGPQSSESQRLLSEIAHAQRTLLAPDSRSAYDAQLRSEMESPADATTPSTSTFVSPAPAPVSTPPLAAAPLSLVENSPSVAQPTSLKVRTKKHHGRKRMPPATMPILLAAAGIVTAVLLISLALFWGRPLEPNKLGAIAAQDQTPISDESADLTPEVNNNEKESEPFEPEDDPDLKTIASDRPLAPATPYDPATLSSSALAGVRVGKQFTDIAPPGAVLVGLKLLTGHFGRGYRGSAVANIQPVYRTPKGDIEYGRNHGPAKRIKGPRRDDPREFIAKAGYAVGEIRVTDSSHPRVLAMQLVFMRLENGRPNPDDSYLSPVYPTGKSMEGPGLHTMSIGFTERPLVGIQGWWAKEEVRGLFVFAAE